MWGKTHMYALSQFTEFRQYSHDYLAAAGKTSEVLIGVFTNALTYWYVGVYICILAASTSCSRL